ncbi:hypothetical protein, partial [Klebsiella pneumoniae]|uniref:hypothetical protein n=1 Tax=Klebsiella pneumoniae TaxID=573 RepID=UPI0027312078
MAKLNSGTSRQEVLTPQDHANELIMMGLRVSDGISRTRFVGIADTQLKFPDLLIFLGLVELSNDRIVSSITFL